MNKIKIKRALVSVSNKTDIIDFVKKLLNFEVEILSTGGTANLLQKEGLSVKLVSEFTGYPEILDGRVKTLHPLIHGALLAKRDNERHQEEIKRHELQLIDLVVVNLYPFEEMISKGDPNLDEAIENIDIGGTTMIRSAAKNFNYVAVITDPNDYQKVTVEMQESNGELSLKTRFELAMKTFKHTSKYDLTISNYLESLRPSWYLQK
ncbi:MAG: IMP cyclohydrolase [bacterium]